MLLAFLPLCSPSQAEGYRFDAVYTGEVFSNVSGGIETGTRYLDNLDLKLEVDIAEAWGFASGRFFVYGLYNNATTLSDELVGDLQGISNIDAPMPGASTSFGMNLVMVHGQYAPGFTISIVSSIRLMRAACF